MICVRSSGAAVRTLIVGAAALAAAVGIAPSAQAQGKLEARYSATLVGIPIGKGSWVIDIGEDQYTAAASGVTTGLAQVFTGGQGTGAARGTLSAGQSTSSNFSATVVTRKKTDEVRMTVNAGVIKEYKAEPVPDEDPERVALTDAHRRGVLDPMTALMMRVPGNGDPLSPQACQRTLAVFDGRLRFDLQMVFKRMEKVKADKGYEGPAVVCAAYFTPVAGHIPSRPAVKYLSKMRDLELWLVPVAGTRVLVPFRMQAPTPFGQGVIEATQFISTAQPKKTTSNGSKAK